MIGGPASHAEPGKPSAAAALLQSFVLPWRACGGAWRGMGVPASLGYHVIGLVVFIIGLLIFDAVFWGADLLREIESGFQYEPAIFLLFVAMWLFFIELLVLSLAFSTMCWGAGSEGWRDGYCRSLARWYQLTPFFAAWTLLLFGAFDVAEQINDWYWDYRYGSDIYSFQSDLVSLLFDLMYPVMFLVYFGLGGWFTLKALAVHRDRPTWHASCRWPAVCEGCGYALVGLGYEQSCPECGRSVVSSLLTPRGTLPLGLIKTMALASIWPASFGRVLLVRSPTPGPARALACSAVMLLLSGPVGVLLFALTVSFAGDSGWIDDLSDLLEVMLIGGISMGTAVMVFGVLLMLCAGSFVGLLERIFGRRSNMPAAAQAACYTGGLVVVAALAMFVLAGLTAAIAEQLDHASQFGLISLLPMIWLSLFALGSIAYLILLWRIVRAARYANV